ncbi:hypothetical protein Zm00014a_026490 [Zea mays]|uniref:Uncharacterized protein n=1 Tax=Zea mays TaxID=4577 RepID=A0A3L6FEE4_MAIZE|nr:hypothetical protein Zm00014a_026490 [Zea mays]
MVSEGDLLQPEKIENGILFNVARRDILLGSSSGVESQGSPREPDVEIVQTECLDRGSVSDGDDKELSVIDDGATDPISRNNLQYQGSSLEENLYCPLSVNYENEINTNKPEAASIFDICTEMHPASINLPEVSSEKTELETAKIPDDKSAVMNDEVALGAGN